MNIKQIKAAVDAGKRVTCDGGSYEVIKDNIGQYLIHFMNSDYYVGLHGQEGTEFADQLNGADFKIS